MSERWSKLPWVEIGILLLAAVLRLTLLDIKPPHFDEGVNGWFADQMKVNGYYHYDPSNYHGPLHMYAVFLSQTLFGRHVWALRLPAILASLLAVGMILKFREFLGATAVRLAALAMAVSPAFVFYGRYSIHESWLVFFNALFLWGLLGLWEKGERRFLFALFAGAAGMILTKETYVMHLLSFGLAGGVLWLWQKAIPSSYMPKRVPGRWTWADFSIALAASLFAILFFYSGNFLDWNGLRGLYQTYGAWFHTGVDAAGHEKSTYQFISEADIRAQHLPNFLNYLNYYWVALMWHYEWPALIGFAACFRYIGKADARLRYLAIYAGGVLLAYSLVPYKTPWCIISMIWPFVLLFGAIVSEVATLPRSASLLRGALAAGPLVFLVIGQYVLYARFHGAARLFPGEMTWLVIGQIVSVLLLIGLIVPAFLPSNQQKTAMLLSLVLLAGAPVASSLARSINLNFFHFSDEKELYVYVQTYPEIYIFTDPLLTMAKKDPGYYHRHGLIVLDSYYPLPWMLGDFTSLGYYKDQEAPVDADTDFILTLEENAPHIEEKLKGNFFKKKLHLRDSQGACIAYFREGPFAVYFKGEKPEIQKPATP